MKRPLVAVALLLTALSVTGGDTLPKSQFTRGDPSLRISERSDSREKGSFVRWTGKLELTGKVVVEFDRPGPSGEQQDDIGVIFFEPSSVSLRKLPAAVGHYYPLKPNVLWLGGTPAEVLSPLLGSDGVQQMVASKPPRFELPARLRLTELYTSVECDHRSYEIKYESLVLLSHELVALGEARNIGC